MVPPIVEAPLVLYEPDFLVVTPMTTASLGT